MADINGSLNNSDNISGVLRSGSITGSLNGAGGGGGTTNYNDLTNKPSINNHIIIGNSTTEELNIDYNELINKPVIPDVSDYYNKSQTDDLLATKANISSLATVATTGSYNDLINKPVIPDVSDYYNKTEIDDLLYYKADVVHFLVGTPIPTGEIWLDGRPIYIVVVTWNNIWQAAANGWTQIPFDSALVTNKSIIDFKAFLTNNNENTIWSFLTAQYNKSTDKYNIYNIRNAAVNINGIIMKFVYGDYIS